MGCLDEAEKDAVIFFLEKNRSKSVWQHRGGAWPPLGLVKRAVLGTRAGTGHTVQQLGAAGQSFPGFSPVYLTTSDWSPREARRCEGSSGSSCCWPPKVRVISPKLLTISRFISAPTSYLSQL